MRFFSPSTGGIYMDSVHQNIPDDALPFAEARYQQVIANPAPGKVRSIGADGLPMLIDTPVMDDSVRAMEIYREQTSAVNVACEASITGGFWSAALEVRYQYGSALDDQLNLTGLILAGADNVYPCRDEQGLKEFRQHTAAQLRQVSDDFTVFKLQLLQKAHNLKQQLDQALVAGDLVALKAITWEALQQ